MDELGNALIPLGEIPNMPSDQLRGTLGTLRGLIASLQAEVARGGDGGGALWKYALRQNAAIEKELYERQAKDRIMAMLSGADVPQEDYTAMNDMAPVPAPFPTPAPAPAAEPAAQMLPQPPPVNTTAPPYASPPARRPRPRTREQQQRREGGAPAVAASASTPTPSSEPSEAASASTAAPARASPFMVPLPSSLQPRDSAQPITTSSPAKAAPPQGAGGRGGGGGGGGEALGSSDEEEDEEGDEAGGGRPMSSASGVRPGSSASVASSSSQRSTRERDGERNADPNHWSRRQKTKSSATANWGKGFVIASGGGGCVRVLVSGCGSPKSPLPLQPAYHIHHRNHQPTKPHLPPHSHRQPHHHHLLLLHEGTGDGAPHRSA